MSFKQVIFAPMKGETVISVSFNSVEQLLIVSGKNDEDNVPVFVQA